VDKSLGGRVWAASGEWGGSQPKRKTPPRTTQKGGISKGKKKRGDKKGREREEGYKGLL